MSEHRIFYLIPDNEKPSGGILIDYLHCVLLREAGINASLLSKGNISLQWIADDVAIWNYSDIISTITENDIVVASEAFPYEAFRFKKAKKVIFVQNYYFVEHFCHPRFHRIRSFIHNRGYAGLKNKHRGKSYKELGFEHVITPSNFLTGYLKDKMNIKATTIPNGIDLKKFIYKKQMKTPNTILCLPRKNPQDLETIKNKVERRVPDYEWIIADNLSQDDLIKKYQEADIFLSTGYPEGFGLPPLEAMACGCVVIGFTGGGAGEFMNNSKTALVSADGDCESVINDLIRIYRDDSLKESLRINGLKISRDYDLSCMKDRVISFFQDLV